jgi:hypothetical protein
MNIAWLSRGAATAERNRRRMQMTGLTPNGYRLCDHFEQSELSGTLSRLRRRFADHRPTNATSCP